MQNATFVSMGWSWSCYVSDLWTARVTDLPFRFFQKTRHLPCKTLLFSKRSSPWCRPFFIRSKNACSPSQAITQDGDISPPKKRDTSHAKRHFCLNAVDKSHSPNFRQLTKVTRLTFRLVQKTRHLPCKTPLLSQRS